MNTTHTPGPWNISWGRFDADIHCGGSVAFIDDTLIAWKENTRLMAAAPELLASLVCILSLYEDSNKLAASLADAGDDCSIARARAAISKATGQTP